MSLASKETRRELSYVKQVYSSRYKKMLPDTKVMNYRIIFGKFMFVWVLTNYPHKHSYHTTSLLENHYSIPKCKKSAVVDISAQSLQVNRFSEVPR